MAHKTDLKQWEEYFKEGDKDGNGSLDVTELRDLLSKGSSKMSDKQVSEAFIFFDGATGDRRISLEEFLKGMEQIMEVNNKIKALFTELDADGSGFLERDELKVLFDKAGVKLSAADFEVIFKDADTSGDGKISLPELMNACN